ncbi:hypothetical protein PO909_002528 [Leuciscus waleckii]
MDRISRRSQGPEGVRFGDHTISSLLFADDVVVLASSDQDLQHALGRFAAECEAAGMKISTSKSEAMVLSRKRVVCPLQVGGEFLPQVEEFKYLGVLFTSEGRMEREIDRRIGAASAVMQSLYRSVVVKKELSRKAKLSIYQSIYVPTLTYGHELWVMTERTRSWIQAAEMSFLRRVAGRSLRDRVSSTPLMFTYQEISRGLSGKLISDYLDNLKIKTRSVCLHQRSFLNPSGVTEDRTTHNAGSHGFWNLRFIHRNLSEYPCARSRHPTTYTSRNTNGIPSYSSELPTCLSRALNWAQALWDSDAPALQSFDGFLNHFSTVFSQSSNAISVHDQLFRLRQGNSSVSDYALRFRTIAASSGWNEIALMTAYRQGLNSDICLQLAIYDDTIGIEKRIQRSILIAQHRTACFQNPSARPPRLSEPVNPPVPEPMEFDSGRLTTTERNRRRTNNLCFYCGASEHYRAECPVRPGRSAVSTVELPFPVSNLKQTPVLLTYRKHSVPAKALIDSGAAGNFISASLLNRLQARRRRLSRPLSIHSILGKPLSNRSILYCSPELQLSIGCLHQERCSLLVLEGSTSDIVLGRPWLNQHSPNICWTSGEVRQWSNYCKSHCLRPIKKNSTTPSLSTSPAILGSTSIESPATDVAPEIPPEYRAFQDVFSKQLATTLPPHRPWDCAIDLLPGATLPHGKVYPLSIPEQKAMEEYVEEALRQGYIRPSTSPAASSFFFVGKKDGGLRPCIDYRILNAATVKYRYPLPLVPSALEQLRSAKIFTKLDLRSAYNLVRIREGDEWKTAFITPAGHYEYRVMPFGLSNSPAIFQGFMN